MVVVPMIKRYLRKGSARAQRALGSAESNDGCEGFWRYTDRLQEDAFDVPAAPAKGGLQVTQSKIPAAPENMPGAFDSDDIFPRCAASAIDQKGLNGFHG